VRTPGRSGERPSASPRLRVPDGKRKIAYVPSTTHYARSGDVSIAYRVSGSGSFDLVWIPGFVSNVDIALEGQDLFFGRLAGFCRLIRFDKRGTGMSDRVGIATAETRMDDIRAVMDAAGSARAALLGASDGGPLAMLFAASYPERTAALILWSSFARYMWAPDYPSGLSSDELEQALSELKRRWSDVEELEEWIQTFAPGMDPRSRGRTAAAWRQSASPGDIATLLRTAAEIDVRPALGAISAPTLVMTRRGEIPVLAQGSSYLADRIRGARLIELAEDADHLSLRGGIEAVVAEVEQFLAVASETDAGAEPDRVLATLLFSDIVDSTRKAAALGDREWRELLERHHQLIRDLLRRYRGNELDTAGDGFLASFDGPARAIRCACAVRDGMPDLGLQVRIGLHTGECELIDGKLAGIAVHTGARVAGRARPGEVLVSSTVKDLVAGAEFAFEDRGRRELKGIPGRWHVFAVAN
jgi:class 3 adenylate cyclase